MKPIERVSLVDAAIAQMRDAIISGTWPIGSRIPAEADLCLQLQMSRASVREATRALVHAGLLVTRQGDGTYVVAADETQVALERRLDDAAIIDVIEVRRGLDVAAARLAAQRRTTDDLERLHHLLDLRADAAVRSDRSVFATHDADFHVAVAAATHNAIFEDLYRGLAEAIRRSVDRDDCFVTATSAESEDSHVQLVVAIKEGDGARAVQCALAILDGQQTGLSATPDHA